MKILFLFFLATFAFAEPEWINNPDSFEFLGGVGIANAQDGGKSIQKKIAITLARSELAEKIKVSVSSSLEISKKCTDEVCNKEITQRILQRSEEILKGSFVKDSYFDENTKELYVLVVIPKEKEIKNLK